jgi:glutaminase
VERTFAAGARIFRSGDPAESLYFILSGQVQVVVETDKGHQLRLTTLGPGTVFGEVALVNERRRTADVMAATPAKCLEVCVDALHDRVHTKMLVNMAGYFAGKIEQASGLMQHLGGIATQS